MKQAILITAYKDFGQLIELIKIFNKNFNFYIHIDKKSKINNDLLQGLVDISNVEYVSRKYKVNWGGLNHLKAIILLSVEALKNGENINFHMITGQDFPVKTNEYFIDFFDNSKDNLNYLEYFKLPTTRWAKGGMDRLEYYNAYDLFNAKSYWGEKCINKILSIQYKMNFKRKVDISLELYGGSTYWTLHRDVLQHAIVFTNKNPFFFKQFRFTFCAEEVYFQTIIMNSAYASDIVNDNLRFIDWDTGRRGTPAFLDETDYDILFQSNKLFARKIDSEGNNLLQMLTTYLSGKS